MIFKNFNSKKIEDTLKNGGVAVIPTDTLYGIVSSALDKKAVKKVYLLKKRNPKKPPIILISSLKDLIHFSIKLDKNISDFLKKIWPDKISVVLPCKNKKFSYLAKEKKSLAFRIPQNTQLLKLLKKTGPLIAPSANWEGNPPAENIKEAKKYFGEEVDFYIDNGVLKSLPSTLISIKNGKIKIERQGGIKLPPLIF